MNMNVSEMEIPTLLCNTGPGNRCIDNRRRGFSLFCSIRSSFRATTIIATLCCVLVWLVLASPAAAQTAIERVQFSSAENKALYAKLTHEFRCLKCQNQNLAGSAAGIADDLKIQIFEMVEAGKSASEITDFMVARYGDFILYRPAFKPLTLLLWILPGVMLLLGILSIYRMSSRQTSDAAATDGSAALADGAVGIEGSGKNYDADSLERARRLLNSD